MRVLIADDDPVSRHLLLRTLQGWGFDVTAAKDGSEAWRLLQESDYSLVVFDWSMPGLDGPELVRRLRAMPRPGYIYTVLLAATSERGEFLIGMESGADDFMVKPLDREELRMRLRAGERILRLEQTLLDQNRALADRNQQMEADLRMACEVQQALLPQGYPTFPPGVPMEDSRLRFIDRYRPDGAVGGDFFIVLALSDSRACAFVADVMGHGVRAALGTAIVRALAESLRPSAEDPGKLLEDMNRELVAILGQASVPMFLSAFCGVMDTDTSEFRYANAGHPDPIWMRRSEGTCTPLPPPGGHHGPPLGVRQGAMYPVASVTANAADLFIFYTDGLIEATNAEQEPFGEARLCEALGNRMAVCGGRLFDEVLAEVLAFTQGRGFADDVCMVGMDVRAEL